MSRYITRAVLAAGVAVFSVTAVRAGVWELSSDGRVFSFQASDADVAEVLRGIEDMTGISVRARELPVNRLNARYFNMTLEDLLARLQFDCLLEYTRDAGEEEFRLDGGWISYNMPVRARATPAAGMPGGMTAAAAEQGRTSVFPEEVRKKLSAPPHEPGSPRVYRCAVPVSPKIDGRTADWPDGVPIQSITSAAAIGSRVPTNDADASFTMAGVADGTNMYLSIAVRDDRKAVTNAVASPWQNDDSLRLILAQPGGTGVTVTINRHHVLSAVPNAAGVPQAVPVQFVSYNSGVKAAIVDHAEGWGLEVAVPLAPFGVATQNNARLGFNILLQDVDAGRSEPAVLSWNEMAHLPGAASDGSLGELQFTPINQ